MTEHIEGLELAFGDGKEWCVSDNFGRQKCDHNLHPYIIADVGGRYGCKVVYGQHSGGGAYFIGHEEVNEANANLIAAAPTMYQALLDIREWLLFDENLTDDAGLWSEAFVKANNAANAALAQARGHGDD